MKKQTFGVIVTTRDFFPTHLAVTAKKEILHKLDKMGYNTITVSEKDTNNGVIVSYNEAKICAELFKSNADKICGIIVVLPNFGEETGVAQAIDMARLDVPVLVQACDDDFDKLGLENRRDAFCGKISVCNNLRQRNIKYTLTALHTCKIDSAEFTADIERFAGVCRVVNGVKNARIAAIGTRPNAFNTVRYSEKLLQSIGTTVCTVGMAEVMAMAKAMDSNDEVVTAKIAEIKRYGKIPKSIINEKIVMQAKLCIALESTVKENHCQCSAVECWNAVQNNYGCATCLSMSMMGEKGMSSACEMDVTGALTMHAMSLASETPSAYLDWNNNVNDKRDMCINLHCSNIPKSFFGKPEIEIGNLDVLATTIGEDLCFGACKGQVAKGGFTFAKLTTDDVCGKIKMYIGTGSFLDDEIKTKGGVALCKIDNLQGLMQYMCKNGFEHHVSLNRGDSADILQEAFENYLNVEVYRHNV